MAGEKERTGSKWEKECKGREREREGESDKRTTEMTVQMCQSDATADNPKRPAD